MTDIEKPKRLTDGKGRSYDVSGFLGQGGQGTVYALSGGKLAVKLLFGRSQLQRDRLRSKLAWLRTLPLESIAIAKPIEVLAPPHVGYLMQFCSGMVSAQQLLAPPRGNSAVLKWYIETGGLRRRLTLLARLATVLARLHGMGLAFADVSSRNVFISEDPAANEVQLIDADNLLYESSPGGSPIHTPGFGAPELVRDEAGVSTLTDAYSFAVIAFQMLSLVHPLLGNFVRDGEPELEQEAYAGRLPWIDSTSDDRNRASDGIPREMVLSPKLKVLFERNFGAGLVDPNQRPRMAEWLEALESAHGFTVKCDSCNSSFYARSQQCPFCDSPVPQFLTMVLRAWSREMELSNLLRLARWRTGASAARHVVTANEGGTLTASVLGVPGSADIKVTFEERGVGVLASGPNRYWMEQPGKEGVVELGMRKRTLPVGGAAPVLLHFGPADTQHLVAEFEMPRRSRP